MTLGVGSVDSNVMLRVCSVVKGESWGVNSVVPSVVLAARSVGTGEKAIVAVKTTLVLMVSDGYGSVTNQWTSVREEGDITSSGSRGVVLGNMDSVRPTVGDCAGQTVVDSPPQTEEGSK